MRQNNMGRNQEIISLEEYLQKRQAIREKETQKNIHKKKRAGEMCIRDRSYPSRAFHNAE